MTMPGPGDETLEHLVRIAMVDKAYAWWAAGNYEKINPHGCGNMRDRLKQRMLQEKEKQDGQV